MFLPRSSERVLGLFLATLVALSATVSGQDPWQPIGPSPVTSGQVQNVTPNNEVVGAIHTVVAHPTDANVLYIGGVNGGVWRTTNATATQPTWVRLTDSSQSLSIGALELDVTDATHQTLVAGIGRFSSLARIGGSRSGLLRTTNGGALWTAIDGGGMLAGKNVSGVAPRGNTIVISVNTADVATFSNFGVFRSTNGGASFTQVSVGNGSSTGLPGGEAFDLAGDRANPSRLFTGISRANEVGGLNGIYRSLDTGASWTKVSNATMDARISSTGSRNIEIAVGASNTVYVAMVQSGALSGVFRSADGGNTWVSMDVPAIHPGGQGSLHLSIVADPSNPNLVYLGGDRQNTAPFAGNLRRGNASSPLGSQFVNLTNSGTLSNSAPHADSREMVFDAAGNLIETDDGGIYRRTSPQNNSGNWFSLNGNLQTTEFHNAVYDSNSNVMFGGTQDNGTPVQNVPTSSVWSLLQGGDGGDVQVDDTSTAGFSVRYTSSQFLGNFIRSVWNSANSLQSSTFVSLTVVQGAALSAGFYTPVELNAVQPTRLVVGAVNSVYESLDQGNTVREIGPGIGSNDFGRNTLAYGAFGNPDVLYVGSGSRIFVRTAANPAPLAQSTSYPGTSSVLGVVLDPDDPMAAYVVDVGKVFRTVNAGASWSEITGNLLSFSPGELRTVEFINKSSNDGLVVGTNRGVFVARESSGFTSWTRLGSGFPNAPVWQLDYDSQDDVLTAGTLGRGAWKKSPPFDSAGNTPPTVTITAPADGSSFPSGTSINFTGTASDVEDGILTSSIAWTANGNPIGMGGSITTTLAVGSYTVVASVTDSGALSATDSINVTVTAAGVAFSEEFEGDVSGWTATGLWHLVNNSSCSPGFSSPTRAFYYGQDATCNYNTGAATTGTLVSPPISGITASSQLTFDHRRQVESFSGDFDITAVDVSINNGATWTLDVFKLNSSNPSTNAWTTAGPISLSSFAGQTIRVRFRFNSVDSFSNAFAGWFIDDVTVTGSGTVNAPPTVTITAPANGSSFPSGTPINFTGTASDPEDGNLTASIAWTANGSSIGMGGSISATLAAGSYTIVASVTDSGGLNDTDTINITVTSSGVLFSEDFEGDVSGWTATGLWHLVNSSSCSPGFSSPTRAFYYGQDATCNYNTGAATTGTLVSPPISGITASSQLTFDHRRQVESFSGDFDITAVDVSINNGATWTLDVFKLNSSNPSTNAWATVSPISLSSFAGQTIRIRFRFNSVDSVSNTFAGWFVDDVQVTGSGAVNAPPTVTITAPANGSSFPSGTPINFTGTASDPEDGNLTASIAWTANGSSIGMGGSISATLAAGSYTIVASVTDSGGLNDTDTINVTVTSSGVIFSDDFEGSVSGWTATGLWHLVNNSACSPGFSSPTRAFYYGQDATCNYNTGTATTGTLVSPAISGITASSQLTFAHRRQVESFSGDFDITAVDVSINNGATWTLDVFKLNSSNPSTNAWATVSPISLSSFAGQTIRIRFRFNSVDSVSNTFAGWFLDDVQVTGGS